MSNTIQFAFLGLGVGAAYALIVQGIVVTYQGSGVLNFAQASLAMVGGFLFFELRVEREWAALPSIVVPVLVVAAIGALTYVLVMRPLRNAPALAKVAATLGLLVLLEGTAGLIWGTLPRYPQSELPRTVHEIAGASVPEDRLWLVGIAVAVTALLWAFSRYTRTGLAIRAGAENPRGAAALGWSADAMAAGTWALGCGIAGLAGVLIAPITSVNIESMPLFVIPALAAGLLGGMRSYWITLLAALAIGVIEAELTIHADVQGLDFAVPFLVIVLVLVIGGKGLPIRGGFAERLPRVGTGILHWRYLVPAVAICSFLILFVFSLQLLGALITSLSWAVIMLSVVVMLGFTNQLSFEQMAMAGLAALAAALMMSEWGFPFELAAVLAIVVAVPIGAIFALPALRTRGVNLAIVTLGLGVVVYRMLLTREDIVGFNGIKVDPPSLFGLDISAVTHPERYTLFVFIVFVLAALVVANLRRGKAGSALLAVRTNERAAAALGIDVVQTKLFAFVVGATLAAVGGVLLAFQQPTVVFESFTPFNSILAVAYAVIGGIGFVLGPVIGSTLIAAGIGGWLLEQLWPAASQGTFWLAVIGGVGLMLLVVLHPDGAVEVQARGLRKLVGSIRRLSGRPAPRSVREPLPTSAPEKVRPASLDVNDLVVRFGGVAAVDGVSFSVRPGEIVGLIGPNGAGKTTVIDAVTGFVRPAAGVIYLDGRPINGWPAHRRVRAGIGRSFQALELFEQSTVGENIRVASDSRQVWQYYTELVVPSRREFSAPAARAIREFDLEGELDRSVAELSYGHRRLTAIARTIALGPSVLLLDEPAAGLGETESAELATATRRLAREWGVGIVVVEHEMDFVMSTCDRIVVLDFGKQIAAGTPSEVRGDRTVIAAYLGEEDEALAAVAAEPIHGS